MACLSSPTFRLSYRGFRVHGLQEAMRVMPKSRREEARCGIPRLERSDTRVTSRWLADKPYTRYSRMDIRAQGTGIRDTSVQDIPSRDTCMLDVTAAMQIT